jgi:RNA ligase
LWLQSRGHYLVGGTRERHFDLFKTWAACHQDRLCAALGSRYLLYGEWLCVKHTIFYDALPHYFLEFDVLEMDDGTFLSTDARRKVLTGLPLVSAPVLYSGAVRTDGDIAALVGRSRFKSDVWRERLRQVCTALGLAPEAVARETDMSDAMEGLYVKVEEGDRVLARAKFVRATFSDTVQRSGSHWQERPIIPNQLREGVDLFAVSP